MFAQQLYIYQLITVVYISVNQYLFHNLYYWPTIINIILEHVRAQQFTTPTQPDPPTRFVLKFSRCRIFQLIRLLNRNDIVIQSDKNPFIQDIVQILMPFETVTTKLSAEKYVSASKIIPLARGLQRLMVKHNGIGRELAGHHKWPPGLDQAWKTKVFWHWRLC